MARTAEVGNTVNTYISWSQLKGSYQGFEAMDLGTTETRKKVKVRQSGLGIEGYHANVVPISLSLMLINVFCTHRRTSGTDGAVSLLDMWICVLSQAEDTQRRRPGPALQKDCSDVRSF